MSLEERKSLLIQSCFLEMADMDFLTARWAYGSGIFHNFYWSAAQCVEKYFKGALLYNERSVKRFSHNLNSLYRAVLDINPDLESVITMPASTGMGRDNWEGKPMSQFVDYLNRYGSPDSRYSLMGTFIDGPVIHVLDYLCAQTRGFIRHHNFLCDDLFSRSEEQNFVHDRIDVDRAWMLDSELLLERLFARKYQVGQTEALRDTFKSMNFFFFDDRDANESTFGGQHLTMAPLRNHLFRLRDLDPSPENTRIIDELRLWADANMKLPTDVRDALSAAN